MKACEWPLGHTPRSIGDAKGPGLQLTQGAKPEAFLSQGSRRNQEAHPELQAVLMIWVEEQERLGLVVIGRIVARMPSGCSLMWLATTGSCGLRPLLKRRLAPTLASGVKE